MCPIKLCFIQEVNFCVHFRFTEKGGEGRSILLEYGDGVGFARVERVAQRKAKRYGYEIHCTAMQAESISVYDMLGILRQKGIPQSNTGK